MKWLHSNSVTRCNRIHTLYLSRYMYRQCTRECDWHDVCEWVVGWWYSRTTSAHIQTHARSPVSSSILEYFTKLCANMFQIFRLKAKLVFESKSTRMKKKTKLIHWLTMRCIAMQWTVSYSLIYRLWALKHVENHCS